MGVKLGPLRRITAGQQGYVPPVMPYAMARMETADSASAAETYQTGEINISAQVNAVFELQDE